MIVVVCWDFITSITTSLAWFINGGALEFLYRARYISAVALVHCCHVYHQFSQLDNVLSISILIPFLFLGLFRYPEDHNSLKVYYS